MVGNAEKARLYLANHRLFFRQFVTAQKQGTAMVIASFIGMEGDVVCKSFVCIVMWFVLLGGWLRLGVSRRRFGVNFAKFPPVTIYTGFPDG